ncbi:acetyltransferase, GNAT family [Campylobacter sp. FOBRC14]|nr:acetyltransferase, GNAT family [Campylobacter sp. FOBRC14]
MKFGAFWYDLIKIYISGFIMKGVISNARRHDAKRCIELLNLAMEDIAFRLSGIEDRAKSDEILHSFFKSDINRLSYNNVYVFKISDEIVGAICIYHGGDLAMLDKPILQHLKALEKEAILDSECFEDEFYIDSIAVDENFRGRGIAKELIKHAFAVAKQKDFKKISLIVDENKPKVQAFYESLGFKFDTKMIVNFHSYNHMIKEIL